MLSHVVFLKTVFVCKDLKCFLFATADRVANPVEIGIAIKPEPVTANMKQLQQLEKKLNASSVFDTVGNNSHFLYIYFDYRFSSLK